MPKKLSKSIVLSLCCNLFHYYAFSVYAFSSVILAPIFFHTESEKLTKIFGLLTFSTVFLAKPLGSIIFGHIGDKHGRKKALIYSLVAITIATTCIGLIPAYAQIGWASSLMLMICLIVQGACLGGQYTGAIVYIQELVKKEYTAFACSIMIAIGFFGVLLGTATSFVFESIGDMTWEWRVPFLLCAGLGLLLYTLMCRIEESPIFMQNRSESRAHKLPVFEILNHYKKPLFSAIFISSIPVSLLYLTTVYIPNFCIDSNASHGLNPLIFVLIVQMFCMLTIPLFGYVGDKTGKEKILKITCLFLILTPVLVFYFMFSLDSLSSFIAGSIIFSIYCSVYSGTSAAYLSEKFPVIGRYSGMGLGISIGEGVVGGLTPLICVALAESFQSKIAPAYYIILLGILSLSFIFFSNKESNRVKVGSFKKATQG